MDSESINFSIDTSNSNKIESVSSSATTPPSNSSHLASNSSDSTTFGSQSVRIFDVEEDDESMDIDEDEDDEVWEDYNSDDEQFYDERFNMNRDDDENDNAEEENEEEDDNDDDNNNNNDDDDEEFVQERTGGEYGRVLGQFAGVTPEGLGVDIQIGEQFLSFKRLENERSDEIFYPEIVSKFVPATFFSTKYVIENTVNNNVLNFIAKDIDWVDKRTKNDVIPLSKIHKKITKNLNSKNYPVLTKQSKVLFYNKYLSEDVKIDRVYSFLSNNHDYSTFAFYLPIYTREVLTRSFIKQCKYLSIKNFLTLDFQKKFNQAKIRLREIIRRNPKISNSKLESQLSVQDFEIFRQIDQKIKDNEDQDSDMPNFFRQYANNHIDLRSFVDLNLYNIPQFNQECILHEIFNGYVDTSRLEVFFLILPLIDPSYLEIEDKKGHTCLDNLFSYIRKQPINIFVRYLLPYITYNSLRKVNESRKYSLFHLLINNILESKIASDIIVELAPVMIREDIIRKVHGRNLLHKVYETNPFYDNVINILECFIENKFFTHDDLIELDDNGLNCIHYMLRNLHQSGYDEYGNFDYHDGVFNFKIFKLTLAMMEKNDMEIEAGLPNHKYTCWHLFFTNIESLFSIKALKSLFKFLNPETLGKNSWEGSNAFHSLFQRIQTKGHIEVLKTLLNAKQKFVTKELFNLVSKDKHKQTVWHIMFKSITKDYQLNIMGLVVPYLDERELYRKDGSGFTCLDIIITNKNFYRILLVTLLPVFQKGNDFEKWKQIIYEPIYSKLVKDVKYLILKHAF